MGDPSIREGFVQSSIAQGMQAAGSNPNGAMAGFMGMGMGMNAAGGFMGQASQTNFQQMQMMHAQQQAMQQPQMQQPQMQQTPPAQTGSWTCSCGSVNTGKFCPQCGSPAPNPQWTCSCGSVNTGKFCPQCGQPRP